MVCLAAKRVDRILGSEKAVKGWDHPCYSKCIRLHLQYHVRFWVPQYRKDISHLKQVQQRPLGYPGARDLAWDLNNTKELPSLPRCIVGRRQTGIHWNKRILGQTVPIGTGKQWVRSPSSPVQTPSCLGHFQNLSGCSTEQSGKLLWAGGWSRDLRSFPAWIILWSYENWAEVKLSWHLL